MNVLVCGSRDWEDVYAINCVLNGYLSDGDPITVISGMAKGADVIAACWARLIRQELLEFRADWKTYGKSAGPIRNQQMLDEGKPEVVWAFKTKPESVGTDDMIRRSVVAGVETFVVQRVSESRGVTDCERHQT